MARSEAANGRADPNAGTMRAPAGTRDDGRERRSASTEPVRYSTAERGDIARRALNLAGRFRSGCRDLAENHDRYLDEAFDS